MNCFYTPFIRKFTLLICAASALQSCVNEEYNFDNVKTDDITLFGDSIILPLGSTEEILMSDLLTDEVMKDIGISVDGAAYKFDYSGSYPEDGSTMSFGIEPISIDAPALPTIASSKIEVGAFSLTSNPINLATNIDSDIYKGTVGIVQTGQDPLDIDSYDIVVTEDKSKSARRKLRLPSIGQPLNVRSLASHANDIEVPLSSFVTVGVPISMPAGVALNKLFDLSVNNGSITISVSTEKSTDIINQLGLDYSGLSLVFPEEFVLERTANVTEVNNRFKAAFSENGILTVTLKKIDFEKRSTGDKFLPTNNTASNTEFNFGYEGSLYISKPTKVTELGNLNNSSIILSLGVGLTSEVSALSIEAEGLEETIDIAPVTIDFGEIALPKEVLALESVTLDEVTMNVKVPKINLGSLTAASINGYLELQLPSFCTVRGATKVGDKWKINFTNLQSNDLNIAITISEIDTPPIVDGKITFTSETISVSGKAIIPTFRLDDITGIDLAGENAPTIAPSMNYANNITKFNIASFKAAIGAKGDNIKVPLDQLASLRGENEGDISISNISFANPLMNINLLYSLPYSFDAKVILKPYLKDQLIEEGIMTFETTLPAQTNGTKTLTPTTEQVNKLINQLPDSLVLSYDIKAGSPQLPMLFQMEKLDKINLKTDYAISLPFAFGNGLEISKSFDTDVKTLFSDEKVINMLFGEEKSKLTLLGQADNGIPFEIELTFMPKDAEGNLIPETEVKIPGTTLAAGTIVDDKPLAKRTAFNVTVIGTPTNIKRIATLGIKVKAVAVNEAVVRPDCSLKLALKAKLLGGIKVDLNQ